MNKIELLPKDIYCDGKHYQFRMWGTICGRLCIGYVNPLDNKLESLFSVCVEPENEPRSISSTVGCFINEYVGNAVSLNDACEEILDWIEMNKGEYSFERKKKK